MARRYWALGAPRLVHRVEAVHAAPVGSPAAALAAAVTAADYA
ncbi:hypothetical protein ACFV3R_24810 [Streptomyces sp. NPDC059740]